MELARERTWGLPCECGARLGYTCDGRGGMHMARFAQAHRESRVTAAQMGAVLAVAEVITNDRIISGGAR
jgi:hypothetical protein